MDEPVNSSVTEKKPLLLIRHAQPKIDRRLPAFQWQLTAEGIAKCRRFASTLEPFHPTRLLTSPELKANQTGQQIAKILNLPCQTCAGFQETARETVPYFDTPTSFQTAIKQLFQHPTEVVFGEESAQLASARFTQAVRHAQVAFPEDTLAIVTHGTVLSCFVAEFNPVNVVDFWLSLKMPALVVLNAGDFTLY